MCGIIGIVSASDVLERLVEGLRRLEYRGYDSAGVAVIGANGTIQRRRAQGKIANLQRELDAAPVAGLCGIAHTRWATHGKPSKTNAHPHQSGPVAIVHNGIIENFQELRRELESRGHVFESQTDSEVIAHLITDSLGEGMDMTAAFAAALARLRGAYAIAAVNEAEPGRIWAAREGSPLVVGLGEGECFVGSDAIALADRTRRVIYLEEGDWCIVDASGPDIRDAAGHSVQRKEQFSHAVSGIADKGEYRHFMEKEIHEQPDAIGRTLSRYIDAGESRFAVAAGFDWTDVDRLLLTACGTAYYAGAVARYWFESLARLPVEADIASEFRYREPVVGARDAALFISQSGETADTLAALRYVNAARAHSLAIVNVPESSIAREAAHAVLTEAGVEIGVASTKAFTAQLSALACLAGAAARDRGLLSVEREAELVSALFETPRHVKEAMTTDAEIERIAHSLIHASDVLYLGRGVFYPLAMEGALKLKEISYIHAEGYAAGELKHGPIALIEDGTPVVVIAPHDTLFEKTCSNMQEVRARGARVILITDRRGAKLAAGEADDILELPDCHPITQPIVASIPIQLLAYRTAALKGTDVDQPRNLAKSVTVE